MPDLYMDVDVALAEVPVNISPLIDDTDFKAIEGAVAYNAAGLALRWHFVTSAGGYTVTSVTPTTGGAYDWTDQGDSGIYTIEIPASGGASINNDTEGYGWFTGVATGVLPWRGPIIGFRAAALNDSLCDTNTTALATSANVTASERNVRQVVESQRGHHTACGAIFYVQKGGSDANPGTYALPFLTIQAALNACTANAHDTVVVLGVTGSDPSTFSEALTMSKAYVFLRGMGRDVKVTTAGAASSTLTVSAKGCEVSGLWVNNTGPGATKGIETASGSDFVWLHHLFIDGAATGVGVVAGANITVENCRINDCATAGVNVAQGAGAGLAVRIITNHIDGSTTGINFAGSDSNESIARYNNISQCTTGVAVASGATSVQVTDNRFAGNTTDWTDAGTNTNLAWNALSTTIAGVIPLVTTTTTVTGAVGSVTGAVGSVTGLTASDVAAIKAKTDSLTFTVAGQVDANIQSVNDVTVTGNGQPGTEWGP